MKIRVLGLFGLSVLAACASRSIEVEPVSPEHGVLESAYQQQDPALLDGFFRSWEEAIAPLGEEQRSSLPRTDRALYEIFEVFYTPDQISRIGDSEVGPDIYTKFPYYAVQNVLHFTVVDRILRDTEWTPDMPDPRTLREGKIENFRPRIAADAKRNVFLNPRYEKVLRAFLGDDLSEVDEGGLMNAPFPRGESKRRADFLGKKIRVMAGHWGGWQIATHPYVNRININEALDRALVEFSLVYQGGEASFQRNDGGWEMTDSRLTWIQ